MNSSQSGKPDQPDVALPEKACPICGKPAMPEFRPFCSARCTDVDLNRWLGGVYAIPASDDEATEDDGSN